MLQHTERIRTLVPRPWIRPVFIDVLGILENNKNLEYKVKIRAYYTYPLMLGGRLGVDKGGELLLIMEKDEVVLKPVKTIFRYAVETESKVEISVKELEKESKEMQEELYGG